MALCRNFSSLKVLSAVGLSISLTTLTGCDITSFLPYVNQAGEMRVYSDNLFIDVNTDVEQDESDSDYDENTDSRELIFSGSIASCTEYGKYFGSHLSDILGDDYLYYFSVTAPSTESVDSNGNPNSFLVYTGPSGAATPRGNLSSTSITSALCQLAGRIDSTRTIESFANVAKVQLTSLLADPNFSQYTSSSIITRDMISELQAEEKYRDLATHLQLIILCASSAEGNSVINSINPRLSEVSRALNLIGSGSNSAEVAVHLLGDMAYNASPKESNTNYTTTFRVNGPISHSTTDAIPFISYKDVKNVVYSGGLYTAKDKHTISSSSNHGIVVISIHPVYTTMVVVMPKERGIRGYDALEDRIKTIPSPITVTDQSVPKLNFQS